MSDNNDSMINIPCTSLQRSTKASGTSGKRFRRLERIWTHDEQKLLIDFIASRPAIWDSDSELYKNREIRKKIWTEIAEVTKHSINDAKNYWNNLRSRFNVSTGIQWQYIQRHASFVPLKRFCIYRRSEERQCCLKISILAKNMNQAMSFIQECSF